MTKIHVRLLSAFIGIYRHYPVNFLIFKLIFYDRIDMNNTREITRRT